jgi:hypothetical protein
MDQSLDIFEKNSINRFAKKKVQVVAGGELGHLNHFGRKSNYDGAGFKYDNLLLELSSCTARPSRPI